MLRSMAKQRKEKKTLLFVPACCCSVDKSCPTLCDLVDCSTPGSSVLHNLSEFAQICVHCVGDLLAQALFLQRVSSSATLWQRMRTAFTAFPKPAPKWQHWNRLLLSRFSRVRLCATPWTAAHQASPSLGFSRQEHWSGLPFPPPMHESEKSKWSRSVVSAS